MECNRDEALRAKVIAEQKYAAKDLLGAKKFLVKALQLHPALEGAPQLLAVVEVELVTQKRITSSDFDWYGILQVDQIADDATIKKQYRKLALALHPDKNKLPGAEAAFKLVGEANGVLADKVRRQQFELRRATLQPYAASNGCHGTAPGANGSSSGNDTFWTSCPACRTGFQYNRQYLNIRVQCQNCRGFFTTKEEASQTFFPWTQHGAYQDRPIPNGFSGGAGANKEAPGTAAKAAEVVQQTFEKVKRDRVEAERESKRKEKERLKESKRKSKEEQEKEKPKAAPKPSNNVDGPTPMQVDEPLKEPAVKVESEKKGAKSRKRSRRKDPSSDEEEVEAVTGGDTDEGHEDGKDVESTVDKRGEGHVPNLRRSLRARNPNVAYTFGDSEEDDDLVDFMVPKKPRVPQEPAVATEKAGVAVQDLKIKPPAANGNVETCADNVQQPDGSPRAEEVRNSAEKTCRKGPSANEPSKNKMSEGRSKPESAGKGDRMVQGHSKKLAHGESSEAELQEYLLKGDKKERQVVNLINSDEIKESMNGRVGEESAPKTVDKGKKVMADGVPEMCEARLWAAGLQSNQAQKVPLSSGASWKAADEGVTGSKLRSGPSKSKSPGGSGTYNRSAAVKEKQEDIRSNFAGRFLRGSNANATPPKRPVRTTPTRKRPSPTVSPCCPTYTSSEDSGDITVPDTEFHMFDNDRGEGDINPGQIWAIYDDEDGMPRFYGKIVKVELSPFKADVQWLEPYQMPPRSAEWVNSTTLALSCGEFKLGNKTVAKQVNIFSHPVVVGKGLRNVMKIYPRKHDVWALYQDWDKKWPNPKKDGNKSTQYDMVEVTSDYCEEMGVDVAPLTKVEGFASIFKRRPGVVDSYTTKEDLLRFSHKVPAVRLVGNEGPGVPKDSWELDTASMPSYLTSQPV